MTQEYLSEGIIFSVDLTAAFVCVFPILFGGLLQKWEGRILVPSLSLAPTPI